MTHFPGPKQYSVMELPLCMEIMICESLRLLAGRQFPVPVISDEQMLAGNWDKASAASAGPRAGLCLINQ
jgi:hypothetical protein